MPKLPPILNLQRLCRQCGYSLEGHTGEPVRCPECGGLNWTENRFQLLRRPLKFGPHYVIRDRREQPLYNIHPSRGLRVGHRLTMVHISGDEALVLKQRPFTLAPTWELQRPNRPMAVARRRLFNWFSYTWRINFPSSDNIEVRGNFSNHEYQFYREAEMIAVVSRRWFSWRHSFGIEIRGGEDVTLLLAAAVVLDMIDQNGAM
jgi:uncharacterized protein YxjI